MSKNPKNLFEEQQALISEIEEHIKTWSAAQTLGAAISVMNLMEGVMAHKGTQETVTTDANVALAGAGRFLKRLQSCDEKELMIAEGLSKISGAGSKEAEWGRKVARVIILSKYLLLKSPKSFGVIADVSARDLMSNLKRKTLIEPAKTVTPTAS